MQPQDLNLTTTVTGHQLFLFVTFGDNGTDGKSAVETVVAGRFLSLSAIYSIGAVIQFIPLEC